MVKDIQHPKYQVGQVWRYRTRPGEEDSRLTILKIEAEDSGKIIIHVRIDGLVTSTMGGQPMPEIPHLPTTPDDLDDTVIEVVDHIESVPDFSDGYSMWRSDRDDGYALPIIIPITGWLSSRFGRKRYLLFSLGLFSVVSAFNESRRSFHQIRSSFFIC